MIEYDFIVTACKDMQRRIDTLIRVSHDDVEAAHLRHARHAVDEVEIMIQWARECHEHPRQIV